MFIRERRGCRNKGGVSSVAQSCLTLCDPRAYSTHVHRVGDATCHSTISSSVVPFSSCLQSFPASGSFPVSQFFASSGRSTGASASASRPSNEYPGLPMNVSFRTDQFNLLAVQGILKSLLQHHSSKASILWHSVFFKIQLSHPYILLEKPQL